MSGLTVETMRVREIPTLVALPPAARTCPLLFFVPGYGATKEVSLSLAYRLAQKGIACASFDPLHHGERYSPYLDRAFEPDLDGLFPRETGLDITSTSCAASASHRSTSGRCSSTLLAIQG